MSDSKLFALFVHHKGGTFEVRLALTTATSTAPPNSHPGRPVEQGDRAYAGASLGTGDSLEQAIADARRSHMWPDPASRSTS